jgi:hypothetical protein
LQQLFEAGGEEELFVNTDDTSDFEVMFANLVEPVVGSYSRLGLFAQEPNYLIFA